MYYASFGMIALILHFIINHHTLKPNKEKSAFSAKQRYNLFLYSVAFYYVTDIIWGVLYYEQRHTVLTYTDTVLYFFTMALSVFLWTRFVTVYVDKKGAFNTFLRYAGYFILAFGITVLVINFFTPIMFSFDADGKYSNEYGRDIYFAMQTVLFLIASVYAFIFAEKTGGAQKLRCRAIGFSGLTMAVFVLLQMLDPLKPFYAVGCMITTCIVHVFVAEDEREYYTNALGTVRTLAYTDSLTGLRNFRAYVELAEDYHARIVSGELTELGIVIFDLNDLKTINDTQGHSAGDEYIKSGCACIREYFDGALLFRIGGDEFLAVLEGEAFKKRHEALKAFNEKMEENNEKGLLVIASGLAELDREHDIDCTAMFRRADANMYERKKQLHIKL